MTEISPETMTADRKRKLFWARVVALLVLVAIAFLRPKVEAWLNGESSAAASSQDVAVVGGDSGDSTLADLAAESGITIVDASESRDSNTSDSSQPADSASSKNANTAELETVRKSPEKSEASSAQTPSLQTTATSATGRAQNSETSGTVAANRNGATAGGNRQPSAENTGNDPPGKLSLIAGSDNRFRSTAGLFYDYGSVDGHRLKHVLKHAKDDLSKPVHGVFTGDRDQILAWIDVAYTKGKKGGKGTRQQEQNGRTVYTVDLGEEIGYVGGQVGERKNRPVCRYLRLVVEDGNEVVTAYPADSL